MPLFPVMNSWSLGLRKQKRLSTLTSLPNLWFIGWNPIIVPKRYSPQGLEMLNHVLLLLADLFGSAKSGPDVLILISRDIQLDIF
jgi:hypothetical protein